MSKAWELVTKACDTLGIKPTRRFLLVSIGHCTLQFLEQGRVIKSYAVSTSRRPPSNLKGSLGTPRGLHAIGERIGAGQPVGMVFKGRVSTGQHFSEMPENKSDTNLITTRILWLTGMEPGVNQGGDVDTHDRYVYIHGTNHEDRIGESLSAGCVLMRNLDVMELFEQVRTGDLVLIVD
ncbi:MAG: L,D-transpeptidase [Cephaloticoccus sp.]|nr:L,D-transpeptidase [Cephaloticoccus sp.]MCF7761245.1 L,D-transpeptidase [Cephaloticoccus sp.]